MISNLLLALYYTCKNLAQLNWEALAAVSAAIACSISMYQISEERKLSNKQVLFDKRTDIAVLLFQLLKCKNDAALLFTQEDDKGIIIVWDMAANYLTGTAEMQDTYNAYANPNNADEKRKLLTAIQKLKERATNPNYYSLSQWEHICASSSLYTENYLWLCTAIQLHGKT